MRQLSWPEVSARRLARHHLAEPAAAGPARVSADMLGVHAQVMSAAEVSIGIRCGGLTRSDVRAALWQDRTLVKTRGPRGTVHLLAAADLPLWTGALSAIPPGASPWPAGVRMTGRQTDEVVAALADAVTDAELTVDELTEALVARVGPWAGDRVMEAFQDRWPRWRQAEAVATSRGALCFGPDRGRRTTYTSPRRWLPGFRPAAAKEAVPWLVRCFLRAYGPATPAQFARWLGAPAGWASEVFARQPDVEKVDFDGVVTVQNAGDDERAAEPGGGRLLPYFDAYLIGCWPRTELFPGRAGERALNGGQAGNVPALLVDGRVAGVWHQRRSGRRIAVTVEAFAPLSRPTRSRLDAEVRRIGHILEATPRLTLGTVTVGAHA